MEWMTILFLALLCSLPAALLLWSATHVGKQGEAWDEDDDTSIQAISTKPIKPQVD